MNAPPMWRRALCLVYESLLQLALLMVAGFVFYPVGKLLPVDAARHFQSLFLLLVLGSYFGWCWLKAGQTLAMKTWKIRLVGADGAAVSAKAAALRFFFGLVIYLPLTATAVWAHFQRAAAMPWLAACSAVFLLAWGWPLLDRERQFLHDRLAGTRLINA